MTVLLRSLAREDRRRGRRLSHVAPLLAAAALAVAGCGSPLDRTKFTGVAAAAAALQADVRTAGGNGPNADRLQAELAAAVRVLATRVDVDEEEAALTAYHAASDAFTAFVRFRALDLEAENGRLILHGTDLEMAKRLGLTIETAGGVSVTDSGAALTTALGEAERQLADATRMVRGE